MSCIFTRRNLFVCGLSVALSTVTWGQDFATSSKSGIESARAGRVSSATAPSALPRWIKFSGTITDINGTPHTGTAGVTFAIYSQSTGSAPLWMETQNVTLDSNGKYSVLLGAGSADGLPADL